MSIPALTFDFIIACRDLWRDAFSSFRTMNPDKLFDYLEGRLPAAERAALEQRLISDKQLQRELAVARRFMPECAVIRTKFCCHHDTT